jgi:hypothetical protein
MFTYGLIWINFIPCRATAQAVCRRPLTAEAGVRSHASPREILVAQVAVERNFLQSTSGFPCQYHYNNAPYSPSFTRFSRQDIGGEAGNLPKQYSKRWKSEGAKSGL